MFQCFANRYTNVDHKLLSNIDGFSLIRCMTGLNEKMKTILRGGHVANPGISIFYKWLVHSTTNL